MPQGRRGEVRVGLLVNPIAGMGGRVGLKGTDGVVGEAIRRGATPVAPRRALEFLAATAAMKLPPLAWLTCGAPMGEAEVQATPGLSGRFEVSYRPPPESTREDTLKASAAFLRARARLIIFVGGDGTARDVAQGVGRDVPILGVPAGVKMHSAVFSHHPRDAARVLRGFLDGELQTTEAEILDVDEEAYRAGSWLLRLQSTAMTPREPNLVQVGKAMVEAVGDEEIRDALAQHLRDLMKEEPETLFVLGPGGTTAGLAKILGLEKTLLGVDATLGDRTVGLDLNEARLTQLLENHPRALLVVSPVGAQGFLLGRGNLQLSPRVIRKIGLHRVLVVATPSKLASTPFLRVDTGDEALDLEIGARGYLPVLVGYRTKQLHPMAP